ncbi:hypothetical protein UPYG_G00043740 [Umbra pygmaea]|uniref:N-acetylaspartate synthetase n=1 Tax=Umbra pygmaea TaxID=75934 RepID=A0ABD0XQK8_UMBPY
MEDISIITAEDLKLSRPCRKYCVIVRKFESGDYSNVERIFYDGLMEMIPDTAFRGLKHHPETLLVYCAITFFCFLATNSFEITSLVPIALLSARYYYSWKVVHGYLENAKRTDMGDIEGHYLKTKDSCLWVAVLDGSVVGVVAARVLQSEYGAVELHRMSVDRSCRRCGIGNALGRKVLEFAADRGYPSVILGTTAYTQAAHRLYKKLGFHCVGITNGYATPGVSRSILEQVFYRVQYHHYRLDLNIHKTSTN